MNRRLMRLLLALVLAVAVTGCGPTKTVVEETGYEGPAKQNPFLAAARFLEKSGHSVKMLATHAPTYPSSTIVAPLEAFVKPRDAKRVMNWVGTGGHLIVLLQDGEQWRDDWHPYSSGWKFKKKKSKNPPNPDEEEEDPQSMLKELGVAISTLAEHAEKVTVEGRAYTLEMRNGFRFKKGFPSRKPTISEGSDDNLHLYSYDHLSGRITLVSSAHPFRNRYLQKHDHAALLRALVDLKPYHEIVFLRALRASSDGWMLEGFFIKAWENGWMAMIALGLLIVFWVWKNVTRFGPAHTPEDHSARGFTENLLLTGAFLWRFRMTNALLEPMRRDVENTLASRGLSLGDSAVLAEVAERTGLPAHRVQMAIAGNLPTDGLAFQKLVEDLQIIRARI